ncbi:MAG: sigma-70 family RNA polymerase sigma factor [Bacteroidota bacterium]
MKAKPISLSPPFSTQNEWVEALSRQDKRAFEWLYKENYASVRSFVLQNNGKEADAKDVFQDGLIAMWQNIKLGTFKLQEVPISAYLYRICKNRWYERLKSASFRKSTTLDDRPESFQEENSLDTLIRMEEIQHIQLIMRQLGQKCQQILKMFYYKRMTMEDIGQRLDMKAKSVKNEKYRCMSRLKQLASPQS